MFFASESDKTPVRKWPISSVALTDSDKAKHLTFDVDGSQLHFNAGSQSTADAIMTKLQSSQEATAPATASRARETSPVPEDAHEPPSQTIKPKKSVNFAPAPPQVIPDEEEEYDEAGDAEGEVGTVLYAFAAEGEDELAVTEGEVVTVVDRQGNDDWWKVRNSSGEEGVVPALYVKVRYRMLRVRQSVLSPILSISSQPKMNPQLRPHRLLALRLPTPVRSNVPLKLVLKERKLKGQQRRRDV